MERDEGWLTDGIHVFANRQSIVQNKQKWSVPLINGPQNSGSMVPDGTKVC
jgi:hypothetical protein